MNVDIGTFHDVVAVAVGNQAVSILDTHGTEHLLLVRPRYDRGRQEFDPINVRGEFGSLAGACGGVALEGLELRNITEIEIEEDFREADLLTRRMSMKNSDGVTLSWELFCK